jgi:inositol 3-alpha-galactosyltransferase
MPHLGLTKGPLPNLNCTSVHTMRRRHNITLATLAFLGTVYLVAQHRYEFTYAHGGGHIDGIEILPSDGLPVSIHDDASAIGEKGVLDQKLPDDIPPPAQEASGLAIETSAPGLQPELSPVGVSPPSDTEGIPETIYDFQNELELELPTSRFQEHSTQKPHNYNPDGPRGYAYATFLATRNPSLKDPYFLAIHSLIYRLLWSSRARSEKHPFVVFVAEHVTDEQRALLTGAGALVRELAPLEWKCDVPGVQDRWKDLFAKLNMWKETEFERILFLDADAFPLSNMDEMFDLAPRQECIPEKMHLDDFLPDGPVCEPYVFAGVPQDLDAMHPNINVGSMVFTPSSRMHARLLQNYVKTDKYDCLMAEQAFLNWQFDPQGAFPGTKLERQWGGFFPSEEDGDGRLKVVHEKLWVAKDGWMKGEWEQGWKQMIEFYESENFANARNNDGTAMESK